MAQNIFLNLKHRLFHKYQPIPDEVEYSSIDDFIGRYDDEVELIS